MTIEPELDEVLEHLKVLRLEPGDVLVVTYPGPLSQAAADIIKRHFAELFPGYRAMVFDQGPTVGVVRQGEVP